MKKLLPVLALALLCAPALGAPSAQNGTVKVPAAERADILKLMGMTHGLDIGMRIGKMFSDSIIASIKRLHPDVSDIAIRDIEQASSDIVDRPSTRAKLVDAIVKLYAKYYTVTDIQGMIRFYGTPLGKKIIRIRPRLSQEAFQAGEDVFKPLRGELVDRIQQYLRRDHIDPKTLKAEKSD
jgi:uncharacterized protein